MMKNIGMIMTVMKQIKMTGENLDECVCVDFFVTNYDNKKNKIML